MTQFLYRKRRRRAVDVDWPGRPEVQPGQPLQAILNSANMQGGDIIELGPYIYNLPKGITIPSYVTLRGVPNKTKLKINFDKDSPEYGPVVTINAYGRLQDCIIDLDLTADGALTGYSFAKDGVAFTTPGGTSSVSSTYNNSVVKLAGARARLQNCYIPAGIRRAVVVSADSGVVIGNEIDHDTTNDNAAVYCEDTVKHCVVSSNICSATAGIITVKTGLDNVVSGNLATLVERA
tara:strand:- start:2867 stop:3571 length:705 start_codon:yes stop_codon:yes gene_type:complete